MIDHDGKPVFTATEQAANDLLQPYAARVMNAMGLEGFNIMSDLSDDIARVLDAAHQPIRVRCKTNLDEYRGERWPETFAVPPVVGEWVTATSGKVLRISSLRHAADDAGPLLIVDLHR